MDFPHFHLEAAGIVHLTLEDSLEPTRRHTYAYDRDAAWKKLEYFMDQDDMLSPITTTGIGPNISRVKVVSQTDCRQYCQRHREKCISYFLALVELRDAFRKSRGVWVLHHQDLISRSYKLLELECQNLDLTTDVVADDQGQVGQAQVKEEVDSVALVFCPSQDDVDYDRHKGHCIKYHLEELLVSLLHNHEHYEVVDIEDKEATSEGSDQNCVDHSEVYFLRVVAFCVFHQ